MDAGEQGRSRETGGRAAVRYHVVTDATGAVVAYGRGADGAEPGPQATVVPLPGQTVYALALPAEAAARAPEALHQLIMRGDWKRHVVGERRAAEAPGTPERRA